MSKIMFRAMAVVALFIGLSACRMAPLYDNQEVSFGRDLTLAQAETAITRGGNTLGWRTQKVGTKHMKATINVRGKHTAIVDITYDNDSFVIMRNQTENLRYDAKTGKIHKNYNSWVQNLENAIVLEASQM